MVTAVNAFLFSPFHGPGVCGAFAGHNLISSSEQFPEVHTNSHSTHEGTEAPGDQVGYTESHARACVGLS